MCLHMKDENAKPENMTNGIPDVDHKSGPENSSDDDDPHLDYDEHMNLFHPQG